MIVDVYYLQRVSLLLGWQLGYSYRSKPNSEMHNALIKFINRKNLSACDEFVAAGVFECFHMYCVTKVVINELSARSLVNNYSKELFSDYFELLSAYSSSRVALPGTNGGFIAENHQPLNFAQAHEIMLDITPEDTQDWKWVGGRYPWEYQDKIDPHKIDLLKILTNGKEFIASDLSFEDFFGIKDSNLVHRLGFKELIHG